MFLLPQEREGAELPVGPGRRRRWFPTPALLTAALCCASSCGLLCTPPGGLSPAPSSSGSARVPGPCPPPWPSADLLPFTHRCLQWDSKGMSRPLGGRSPHNQAAGCGVPGCCGSLAVSKIWGPGPLDRGEDASCFLPQAPGLRPISLHPVLQRGSPHLPPGNAAHEPLARGLPGCCPPLCVLDLSSWSPTGILRPPTVPAPSPPPFLATLPVFQECPGLGNVPPTRLSHPLQAPAASPASAGRALAPGRESPGPGPPGPRFFWILARVPGHRELQPRKPSPSSNKPELRARSPGLPRIDQIHSPSAAQRQTEEGHAARRGRSVCL